MKASGIWVGEVVQDGLDRSHEALPKARDPLAYLDLASGSEVRKSWVERQKERESEASKGGEGRD